MNQKTQDFLTGARNWLEKNAGSDLDTKPALESLETAERAARDVDELKAKLAAASREKNIAFLVLEETLKSARHARKAREAREKAERKAAQSAAKPGTPRKR